MSFNLKKQAQNMENMLRENNKETGSEEVKNAPLQSLLDELRNDVENTITEKRIGNRNEGKDIIIEKKMDKSSGGYNLKRDKSQVIFDQTLEKESESAKNFEDISKKSNDNMRVLSEENVGEQKLGPDKKIPNGIQYSQLIEKYKNRNEFDEKITNKQASTILMELDASLYNIYRTASSNNRELNSEESIAINNINKTKENILTFIEK